MRLKRKKTHFPHPTLERGFIPSRNLSGFAPFLQSGSDCKAASEIQAGNGKSIAIAPSFTITFKDSNTFCISGVD